MTSMEPTRLVQGDREVITATLTDDDDFPENLQGRTVSFVLWSPKYGTVIDRTVSVTAALNGEVRVTLTSDDTARADFYRAEFRIEGDDNDPTTTPRSEPIPVVIRPNGTGG